MDNQFEAIRSLLGYDAVRFEYTAAGRKWTGWRGRQLWPHPDFTANPLVADRWRAFSSLNIRVFVHAVSSGILSPGDDFQWMRDHKDVALHPVVALPELPTVSIVEFAEVGVPWAGLQNVQSVVHDIWQRCPFEVLSAHRSCLHAVFLRPLTPAEITILAPMIEELSPLGAFRMDEEVNDMGLQSVEKNGPSDSDQIIRNVERYLGAYGRFKLVFH